MLYTLISLALHHILLNFVHFTPIYNTKTNIQMKLCISGDEKIEAFDRKKSLQIYSLPSNHLYLHLHLLLGISALSPSFSSLFPSILFHLFHLSTNHVLLYFHPPLTINLHLPICLLTLFTNKHSKCDAYFIGLYL